MTRQGYMGLVPAETTTGDVLCILFSGKVPYILRPLERLHQAESTVSTEYTLMGDAYAHALMDGEALEMIEKGLLEVKTLVLC
jgi:hypothetical protein